MQRADIYYIPFEGGGTRLEVVRCGPRRGRAMLRRLWVHAGSVRRAMQSSAGLHLPKALYGPNRAVGTPTQLALRSDFRQTKARCGPGRYVVGPHRGLCGFMLVRCDGRRKAARASTSLRRFIMTPTALLGPQPSLRSKAILGRCGPGRYVVGPYRGLCGFMLVRYDGRCKAARFSTPPRRVMPHYRHVGAPTRLALEGSF